ncbi:MAG: hypothetical protein WD717_06445 [Nitrosarchaeum sp.]
MSTKKRKGKDYWTFVGGRGNELHLGPAEDISKINSDRVVEALCYLTERDAHYIEIREKLLSFLPQNIRDDYLLSYLDKQDAYSEKKLISSLSDSAKQQYLSKGKQTAEGQTRRRQEIDNWDLIQDVLGFAKKKTDKTTTEKITKYLQEKYGKNVRT